MREQVQPKEQPVSLPPGAPKPKINKGRGGGGYCVTRKPRSDNLMHGAGEDIQLETFNMMKRHSAPRVKIWLADVHGIRISETCLYRWEKRYAHERELDENSDRTARTVARMVKERLVDGSDPDTVKRMESFLIAAALTNGDPSAYVALQKLELERIKLQLEREKIELNKRKLDQLEQLEGIAKNSSMTAEQKGALLDKVLS